MRRLLVITAAACLAGACASPGGIDTTASVAEPAALQAARSLAGAPASGPPVAGDWWKRYGDAQLDELIAEALAGNPSLGVVRARVEQAQALADNAHLALTSTYSGSVESSRQRLSENGLVPPPYGGAWIWQNQAMLDYRHAFDFWGRNRHAYEAALGQVKAAEVDAEAARTLLEAGVARAYLRLAAAFEQRDIGKATLVQREQILALDRARYDAGLDSRVGVREAEGAVPQARAEILADEQAITLARNQLAALVGQGPDRGLALRRPALRDAGVALPSTLPADLVGRRPDVVAQRLRIEASAQGIESARAAFYPNIDLTAFAGLQALDFATFLRTGSLTVGAGPAIHLPIFERGKLRADLAARAAQWDLDVAQYNQTIVDALREVVDEYATLRALEARQRQVAAALRSAEQVRALSSARYGAGVGDRLEVLSAEGRVLSLRALRADLRARLRDAEVALIRALGGGYDPSTSPAPSGAPR